VYVEAAEQVYQQYYKVGLLFLVMQTDFYAAKHLQQRWSLVVRHIDIHIHIDDDDDQSLECY